MPHFSLPKTVAGILLSSVLAVGLAQAAPWGHDDKDGARAEQHWNKMSKSLALTPAQQEQMKTLRQKQRQAMQSMMEQRKKLHQEQIAAMQAPTPDRVKLENLRQQELRLHDQASKQRLEHQLAMAQILTPEQRKKMAEKMQARANKYEKKHHADRKKHKHDRNDDDRNEHKD